MTRWHVPVMREEVLHHLDCHPGGIYVDGTVGMGGHAAAILERIKPDGILLGIDWDEDSLHIAREHLAPFGNRVILVKGNFADLPLIAQELKIEKVDGVLLDLGISSYHLEQSGRGFSFKQDEILDMRIDKQNPLTARHIVNRFPERELEKIIREFGEERWARRIAKVISRQREREPLNTAVQLASLVASAIPRKFHPVNIHPATRTFQALRIAVNRELENLDRAIKGVVSFLKPGGRLCIISFHSLEDRIVKRKFQEMEQTGLMGERPVLRRITRKPVIPSPEECAANPRARSAKLRVAERLAA
ncbi:MAG: 16S rRNA (cytosine(1402)-N(4))-methyltransferase RsmH [Thermodesulfobacteriota bacterium]